MAVKEDSLVILGHQTTHERTDSGVYVLTHIPSMKIYIGSTMDLHQRMIQHASRLRLGHPNKHLQSAYDESPRFNLSFRAAPPNLPKKELLDLIRGWEGELLKQHEGSELLLNIAIDPNFPGTGTSPSKETREKLRQAMLGRFVSEVTRQKRSETLMGHVHSEETREKLRLSSLTPERIAVANNNLKLATAKISRPVVVGDVVYPTMKAAGEAFGINGSSVEKRIKSKNPAFANWSYQESTI